ncbi:golgin subfamily A member 6-like protein 22 [Cydia pomonella]|uniref:golgin subfamily A member 6-like protein 22 n=1 Tax=Cydia pomonella TaxID=82600 RepID=UPI002ADD3DF1|nr:golgin subfamily A member 6-like protein 22 [Cydia pomonella]
MDGNNEDFVEEILQENQNTESEAAEYKHISNLTNNTSQEIGKNCLGESSDKHSATAVWTTSATLTLLKLYEANIEMVETPKKKTRLWVAISDNLKSYNIEMTPDQVRWKINALTKKYKQAVDSGQKRFKYFKEMNNIFGQCEDEEDTINLEHVRHKKIFRKNHLNMSLSEPSHMRGNYESKATIELRKIRLANRIEADRSQSKINLERQWLEYLNRQEEQRQWREEMFERSLKLRERELELRRKELEMKEAFELKKLQLKEREQEELLKIERDKCNILSKMVEKRRLQNVQQ